MARTTRRLLHPIIGILTSVIALSLTLSLQVNVAEAVQANHQAGQSSAKWKRHPSTHETSKETKQLSEATYRKLSTPLSLQESGNASLPLNTPKGLADKPRPASSPNAADLPSGTRTSHAVTFTSEAASDISNMPATQAVADSGTITRPRDNPIRKGWSFDGWSQNGTAYDFSKPVTSDTTLKAEWTRSGSQWSIRPISGPRTGGNDVNISTPSGFTQVAVGSDFSIALDSDGTAYSWGGNMYGQLGNGSSTSRSTPGLVTVPADVKFTYVAAGHRHALAVDREGKVWTWGSDQGGRCGRNGNSHIPGKLPLPSGVTGFTQVTASYEHSMALTKDGKVWTWGENSKGQLGRTADSTHPGDKPGPVDMPIGTTFSQISTGAYHSMALTSDGTLYTWGNNDNGELGRNTGDKNSDHKPVQADTKAKFSLVSGGWDHSIGLAKNHTVYTWGSNGRDQLGRTINGNTTFIPGEVPGITEATDIGAGNLFSSAITTRGTYAWGNNRYGQQGTTQMNGSDDIAGTKPTPVPSPEGTPGTFSYTGIFMGSTGNHTMATGTDRGVYGFGDNRYGQLGNGTTNTSNGPAMANPKPTMILHTGGTLTVKSVTFDGSPSIYGPVQQPDGSWLVRPPAHRPGPVDVKVDWIRDGMNTGTETLSYTYTPLKYAVTFLANPGDTKAYDIQTVDEWGQVTRPEDPIDANRKFEGWFVGDAAYDFTQPITRDMTITGKWNSQTGTWTRSPEQGTKFGGTRVTLTPPDNITGVRLASISGGRAHTLSVSSDGRIYAWGDNSRGQLGDATTINHGRPARVSTPEDTVFVQASAGEDYAVALDTAGRLWTWGDNEYGQLGRGSVGGSESTPASLDTGSSRFVQVSAGDKHILALDTKGRVWSWGNDSQGQLGRSTMAGTSSGIPDVIPMPSGSPTWLTYTRISAGGSHSLALGSNGVLYSWGGDTHGQLGKGSSGSSAPSSVQIPAGAGPGFVWLYPAAGKDHTLATGATGTTVTTFTFGSNLHGQLGNGQVGADSAVPVMPELPSSVNVTGLTAGGQHSQAITDSGALYTWGSNDKGQLGDNTTTEQARPVLIVPSSPGSKYLRAAAGEAHTLAIDSSGALLAWGDNLAGQLGDGKTTTSHHIPVEIKFPIVNVTEVKFGKTAGLRLREQADGSWLVTSPGSLVLGTVPLTIFWSANGVIQPHAELDFEYTTTWHEVKFDSQGGSPAPPSQRVEDGDRAVLPYPDPSKTDFVFDGWFYQGIDVAYDFNQQVKTDLVLVAHWSSS